MRRELGWHLGGTSGMALEGPEDADQLDSPGALATSDCRSGAAALVVFNADADLEVS